MSVPHRIGLKAFGLQENHNLCPSILFSSVTNIFQPFIASKQHFPRCLAPSKGGVVALQLPLHLLFHPLNHALQMPPTKTRQLQLP